LTVYRNALESGDFSFRFMVAESGLLCAKCGTAGCARYHGTWFRKRVVDLSSGTTFTNLPIVRLKFCTGNPKSLFPAELWRGKATVSSVLGAVWDAVSVGVEQALQRAVTAGDGDEPFSERTLRRWIGRARQRVPVACASLGFPAGGGQPAPAKLENFLTLVHPHDLLALRRRWGFAILDVPPPPKTASTATRVKPGFHHPRPPQNPPSRYLRRGSRSRLSRRGRSPDD
jgi:hypothetical protein